MKVLAIIPARGGSKGVPGKNIKPLGGKPLLAHAIECAQGASKVTKIVVSTDAQEIIDVALTYQTQTIKRPEELATDTSNVVTAALHVIDHLEESYDLIVLLQPTSPLRTASDLDHVIEILENNPETDGVISVVKFDDCHPARMYNLDSESNLNTYIESGETLRRQDLEPVYYRNGCFYAVRVAALREQKSFMVKNKKAYVMQEKWLANIDTPRDFKIAEVLYEDWKNEKIVITENEDFSQKAIQELRTIGEVETYNVTTKEELLEVITDADVIFIRLRFKLDKTILKKAYKLKYILTATTGLDHIDTTYFESTGGKIISLRGEVDFLNSIPSTAEHTWTLLLSLMRHLPQAFDDVKQGYWRRDLFKGHNLSGKKIGILGFGRVGRQVAKYAEAFGMQVGFYDIVPKEGIGVKFDSAEELFAWSEIISIHIPLNSATHQFISKSLLDNVSPNTLIINTSRGAVIDEAYLVEKLKTNTIKGYATDVIENELSLTSTTNPLVTLAKENNNIIITPHIAGATYESMHMTENFIIERFQSFLKNEY